MDLTWVITRIDANYLRAFAVSELGRPSGLETQIMSRNMETMALHE
jgi:hypothetical protein